MSEQCRHENIYSASFVTCLRCNSRAQDIIKDLLARAEAAENAELRKEVESGRSADAFWIRQINDLKADNAEQAALLNQPLSPLIEARDKLIVEQDITIGDLRRHISALERELSTLRESMRWIPIGDMPFDLFGRVLVCYDKGYVEISLADTGRRNSEVTHWMPIPEPPEAALLVWALGL